jgi:DNA-binding transcriptional LysR family regulator
VAIDYADGAMELNQVEAFVAIVRGGGVTRAAAILHLSQPAVSRRLELLEHELGAPLFERMRTGTLLTEAGRTFLPHAESLLASMRDGVDAVRALTRVDRGTITLALVGTLASTTLTAHLRAFREAHPDVQLRLRTALSPEVSDLVRRGDATFGLRYEADEHPEILSEIVHHERMIAVCASRHRLARRRAIDPRALAGETWLGFPPRPGARPEPYTGSIQRRLAALGLGAAEVVPVDSLTAQKRMVEAGFGLTIVPESSVEEELRLGTLAALRVPALRATVPIALIRRRHGYLSGAAQRLKDDLATWSVGRASRRRGRR